MRNRGGLEVCTRGALPWLMSGCRARAPRRRLAQPTEHSASTPALRRSLRVAVRVTVREHAQPQVGPQLGRSRSARKQKHAALAAWQPECQAVAVHAHGDTLRQLTRTRMAVTVAASVTAGGVTRHGGGRKGLRVGVESPAVNHRSETEPQATPKHFMTRVGCDGHDSRVCASTSVGWPRGASTRGKQTHHQNRRHVVQPRASAPPQTPHIQDTA